MITNPRNIHVLLWSFRQGCFHFETLDETIKTGMEAYVENHTQQDYIVLTMGTREHIEQTRDMLVKKIGRYTPTRKTSDPEPTNEILAGTGPNAATD